VFTRTFDGFLNLLGVLLWVAMCTRLGLWMLHPHWTCCPCAGHSHTTFHYKNNPVACLEYGRRMRTFFAFQARAMCDQSKELIKKFKAGEYKGHKDLFESDCSALTCSMLDTIQQFDGQEVPDILNAPHLKLSSAHRFCYESIQALSEAYDAEGPEQARLVKESEKKLIQAQATVATAVKEFNSIWAHLAI
jgi:hypothetical protein